MQKLPHTHTYIYAKFSGITRKHPPTVANKKFRKKKKNKDGEREKAKQIQKKRETGRRKEPERSSRFTPAQLVKCL